MITRNRAATPLKALLLTGAMAFGTVALSSAASAATYTTPLASGAQTFIGGAVLNAGEDDVYTLNLTPSPSTGTGTLNLSGFAFTGLQLAAIKLTSGAAFGDSGAVEIAPSTYNVTNGNGSASFTVVSAAASTPLFLTFDWTGTGNYAGALTYTFSERVGSPVPGPIAGAGIPAAFAFGGLLWARRRKAAAA